MTIQMLFIYKLNNVHLLFPVIVCQLEIQNKILLLTGLLNDDTFMLAVISLFCKSGQVFKFCDRSLLFSPKKFSLGLTFIFDLSDWRYQAARRFVLINLISHMCAHWLNLNVSGISIFHFICIPFLFCCGAKVEDRNGGAGQEQISCRKDVTK